MEQSQSQLHPLSATASPTAASRAASSSRWVTHSAISTRNLSCLAWLRSSPGQRSPWRGSWLYPGQSTTHKSENLSNGMSRPRGALHRPQTAQSTSLPTTIRDSSRLIPTAIMLPARARRSGGRRIQRRFLNPEPAFPSPPRCVRHDWSFFFLCR